MPVSNGLLYKQLVMSMCSRVSTFNCWHGPAVLTTSCLKCTRDWSPSLMPINSHPKLGGSVAAQKKCQHFTRPFFPHPIIKEKKKRYGYTYERLGLATKGISGDLTFENSLPTEEQLVVKSPCSKAGIHFRKLINSYSLQVENHEHTKNIAYSYYGNS